MGCGEDARGHSKAPKDVMPRQWVLFRSSSRFRRASLLHSPSALFAFLATLRSSRLPAVA